MRYEKEMIPSLQDFFEEKRYVTTTELFVGTGIADIVALKPNEKEVGLRKSHNIGKISFRHLRSILNFLERKNMVTIKELSDYLHISPSYCTKLVDDINPLFVKKIKVNSKYHIIKFREYTSFAEEIIAIEAKLNNWKKALRQAYFYLDSCEKSYVAILEKTIKKIPKEALEWMEENNIGLLSVKNSEIKEIIPAKKQKPRFISEYYKTLERAWPKLNF